MRDADSLAELFDPYPIRLYLEYRPDELACLGVTNVIGAYLLLGPKLVATCPSYDYDRDLLLDADQYRAMVERDGALRA